MRTGGTPSSGNLHLVMGQLLSAGWCMTRIWSWYFPKLLAGYSQMGPGIRHLFWLSCGLPFSHTMCPEGATNGTFHIQAASKWKWQCMLKWTQSNNRDLHGIHAKYLYTRRTKKVWAKDDNIRWMLAVSEESGFVVTCVDSNCAWWFFFISMLASTRCLGSSLKQYLDIYVYFYTSITSIGFLDTLSLSPSPLYQDFLHPVASPTREN